MTFRLNWAYIAFILLFAAGALGFVGFSVTQQTYDEWSNNSLIVHGLIWPVVVSIDLICILSFIALNWKIYCDANTKFGEEFLSQPSVFGTKKVKWSDVTDIKIFNGISYIIWASKNCY